MCIFFIRLPELPNYEDFKNVTSRCEIRGQLMLGTWLQPRPQGLSSCRPLQRARNERGWAVRRETLGTRLSWLRGIMVVVFIKTNVQSKMTNSPLALLAEGTGNDWIDSGYSLLFCRFQSVHWSRNTMTCPAFYSALIQSVTKKTVSVISEFPPKITRSFVTTQSFRQSVTVFLCDHSKRSQWTVLSYRTRWF